MFKNEITIARTGYTGEDGVEIMINHNDDEKLIDLLDELNIPPCGLGSRDTLRLEASLPLYGQELNENISPVEIGFKWVVDTDHEFYGKDVLLQSPLSKMAKWKGAANIDAIKAMDRWIEE